MFMLTINAQLVSLKQYCDPVKWAALDSTLCVSAYNFISPRTQRN